MLTKRHTSKCHKHVGTEGYAQISMRNNLTAAEELRQCQSPQDAVELQMKLARQAYDDYMDEAKKLSDLVVKVSSEAFGYMNMPK